MIYGLDIEREDDPDYGCLRIALRQRDRRVEIARDLSPVEREQFYSWLINAMHETGGCPRTHRLRWASVLPFSPTAAI